MKNEILEQIMANALEFIHDQISGLKTLEVSGSSYNVDNIESVNAHRAGYDEEMNVLLGIEFPVHVDGVIRFNEKTQGKAKRSVDATFRLMNHNIRFEKGIFVSTSPEKSILFFYK